MGYMGYMIVIHKFGIQLSFIQRIVFGYDTCRNQFLTTG